MKWNMGKNPIKLQHRTGAKEETNWFFMAALDRTKYRQKLMELNNEGEAVDNKLPEPSHD